MCVCVCVCVYDSNCIRVIAVTLKLDADVNTYTSRYRSCQSFPGDVNPIACTPFTLQCSRECVHTFMDAADLFLKYLRCVRRQYGFFDVQHWNYQIIRFISADLRWRGTRGSNLSRASPPVNSDVHIGFSKPPLLPIRLDALQKCVSVLNGRRC